MNRNNPFASEWWQRPAPRLSDLTDRTDHEIHAVAPLEQLTSEGRVEAAEASDMEIGQVLTGLGVAWVILLLLKRAG